MRDELLRRGAHALFGASTLLTLSCSSGDEAEATDAEVEATQANDAATVQDAKRADAAIVDARMPAAGDAALPGRRPSESAPWDAAAPDMRAKPEGTIDAGAAAVREAAVGEGASDAARQPDASAPQAVEAGLLPTDAMAPRPPQPALAPRLVSRQYEGELCPADSLSISAAGDDSAITIVFSTDVQGDGSRVSRRCTIRLGFEVPAGHAFGNLHVYASGYAAGSEGSAGLTMDYAFSGQEATQRARFDALREDYVVHGKFDRVWSPSCADDSKVELVLDVDLSVSGDQQLLLSALDMGFHYSDGALWKRCADDSILRPPPAAKDQACAGPAQHPCAEGLLCDLFDAWHGEDHLLQGECADPAERLPPAQEGSACGGVTDIACADGLRCHYTSEARARRDVLGLCARPVGRKDDRCGGYPAVTCAEGLVCSENARDRCVASD